MRMFALLLLFGCSADPIVGAWTDDKVVLDFQRDGSIVASSQRLPDELACPDMQSAEAKACDHAHRWERSGDGYRITIMAFVRKRPGGMLNTPGPACACEVLATSTAELHGDELVVDSKTRAHRVKR